MNFIEVFKKDISFKFLIVAILIEFSNKFIEDFHFHNYSFSLSFIFKFLFVIFCISNIIFRHKNNLFYSTIILLVLLLSEALILNTRLEIDFIVYGVRYMYFIFLIWFYKRYCNKNTFQVISFFDKLLFINSILIISGAVFTLSIFRTYLGSRFGFNGFFNMISDSSYIYALYIIIHIIEKNKKTDIIAWFNILVASLIGTKIVVFFVLIFIMIQLYNYNKSFLFKALAFTIITTVIFYKKVINLICIVASEHCVVYESEGFLASISSYRFSNLIKNFKLYLESSFSELLFHNSRFIDLRVEMELFDLILFWGYVGVSIYVITFYIIIKSINLNIKKSVVFVILIFVSLFAGKLLTNFIASIFIYLYIVSHDHKKDKILKHNYP